jgi:hypothetical protein
MSRAKTPLFLPSPSPERPAAPDSDFEFADDGLDDSFLAQLDELETQATEKMASSGSSIPSSSNGSSVSQVNRISKPTQRGGSRPTSKSAWQNEEVIDLSD